MGGDGAGGGEKKTRVKLVLQQCLSARLRLPSEDVLEIGPGVVAFVCFRQGADEEVAARAAEVVASARLCETDADGKRVSAAEARRDVLVVPPATLGGKLKGAAVQYHGNVGKGEGLALYECFCRTLKAKLDLAKGDKASATEEAAATTSSNRTNRCECGVYGAGQVLSTDTNGPYTHVFEL